MEEERVDDQQSGECLLTKSDVGDVSGSVAGPHPRTLRLAAGIYWTNHKQISLRTML